MWSQQTPAGPGFAFPVQNFHWEVRWERGDASRPHTGATPSPRESAPRSLCRPGTAWTRLGLGIQDCRWIQNRCWRRLLPSRAGIWDLGSLCIESGTGGLPSATGCGTEVPPSAPGRRPWGQQHLQERDSGPHEPCRGPSRCAHPGAGDFGGAALAPGIPAHPVPGSRPPCPRPFPPAGGCHSPGTAAAPGRGNGKWRGSILNHRCGLVT